MKYLEWNNAIGAYLFKPDNAGNNMHIYVSKPDIVNIGRKLASGKSDEEIWGDFLSRIKSGMPGSPSNDDIMAKALYAYEQWKKPGIRAIDGVNITYPAYLAYLVFVVLPLIEIQGAYNANNYYDRLKDFLARCEINQNLKGRLRDIEELWSDLANWVNNVRHGELGIFQIKNFIHPNWKFVGKPFSQCVLPPRAMNKMALMFLEAGWVPDSFYPEKEFKKILMQYGSSILLLSQNAIDLIKKSETDELGQSIIEAAKREYSKWTGESHSYNESGEIEMAKRNYTPCRLYLQFEPKINSGKITFSYRMYSSNDYPADLKIGGQENIYEARGWSRTLTWPFKEAFEYKDDQNKWVARFPKKDVRLFVNGSSCNFSADYWLEADALSRTEWMYLMCSKKLKDSVFEWGKKYCATCDDDSDFDGLPEDYCLFKILSPKESHPDIPLLTVYTEKSVKLTGGLNLNFRTYMDEYLPEVEIANCVGDEKVILEYRSREGKIHLQKTGTMQPKWLLPSDIMPNEDFVIKVEGENLSGNEFVYRIESTSGTSSSIDPLLLPKRNKFGKIVQGDPLEYCIGSNVIGNNLKFQQPFRHLFNSLEEEQMPAVTTVSFDHSNGNALLEYLTVKGSSTTEEFYKAFEFLHLETGKGKVTEGINYSKLKKASLNYFDYLGFLDFEYETKTIVVNPPQFIYVPAPKGRKCLLIGGRDKELVDRIIKRAPERNIQVEIFKQVAGNENLLLPDAITIRGFSSSGDKYGEKALAAFAAEIGVKMSENNFIQLGLMDFSAGIYEYERNLIAENETSQDDYGWARKKFNTDTLQYEWHTSADFDKKFSLLEYKLNEYTFHNRLWLDGKCYAVDKNWGKYIALKHAGKQVILYDEQKRKAAIPLELPLPRLLAEAVMLMSGLAPAFLRIAGHNYRVYENIPSTTIKNLFHKLNQEVKIHSL